MPRPQKKSDDVVRFYLDTDTGETLRPVELKDGQELPGGFSQQYEVDRYTWELWQSVLASYDILQRGWSEMP